METPEVEIYTLKLDYYCLRTKTLGNYSSLEKARKALSSYISNKDGWKEKNDNYWINPKRMEELKILIGIVDPDSFYDSD